MGLFKNLKANGFIRYCYYKLLPFGIQAYISRLVFKPEFGENMVISRGRKWYYGDVKFGRGVRIAANSIFANIEVGNYTIFAEHFRMYVVHHDYTAYPLNDVALSQLKERHRIEDVQGLHEPNEKTCPRTKIGSDVWIGEYVTVKPGITIGDGAVVAGGSIVTHDVEPYSIIAGVPARFIGWRLDKEKRDLMMKCQWWNWSEEKIAANYEKLCRFDETLVEAREDK